MPPLFLAAPSLLNGHQRPATDLNNRRRNDILTSLSLSIHVTRHRDRGLSGHAGTRTRQHHANTPKHRYCRSERRHESILPPQRGKHGSFLTTSTKKIGACGGGFGQWVPLASGKRNLWPCIPVASGQRLWVPSLASNAYAGATSTAGWCQDAVSSRPGCEDGVRV
jgi:hypothetical protein